MESELLWNEGNQKLGQAARRWERGGRRLCCLRDTGRGLLLWLGLGVFFMGFLSPLRPVAKLPLTSCRACVSSVSLHGVSGGDALELISPPATS